MASVANWYSRGHAAPTAPKVSVSTITYGHEAYIADAIEGVLMQEVDFPVEMVIGEDCSPDRTREIILDYQERYPGFIRLSDYPSNIGAGENFRGTISRCRGEYVALLDGDDYWTSPNKLSRQVALMEAHPGFSLCFHPVMIEYDDARVPPSPSYPPGRRPVYRLSDLYRWIGIETASVLFRRSALPDFPDWFLESLSGDWALQFLLATKGDIGYIDEVMASYRQHHGSIFFGRRLMGTSKYIGNVIAQHERFCAALDARRARPFLRAKRDLQYKLAHKYIDEGDPEKALETIKAAYRAGGYTLKTHPSEPFRALIHLYAPGLYGGLRAAARWARNLASRAGGATGSETQDPAAEARGRS